MVGQIVLRWTRITQVVWKDATKINDHHVNWYETCNEAVKKDMNYVNLIERITWNEMNGERVQLFVKKTCLG